MQFHAAPLTKLGGKKSLGSQKLPFDGQKTYDLIVIGGGSGGLATALEAKKLGLDVALFDATTPSIHGSQWGLGGTCLNVGCIPKKLFHFAALNHAEQKLSSDFGWQLPEGQCSHDWLTLRNSIQSYIKSANFGYAKKLREQKIDYVNAKASFTDANTISFMYKPFLAKTETEYSLKARNFVIATGGRPRGHQALPAELYITSDDLFSLKEDPGETLVVGGGYIAVECAGFLAGLGKKVHLINRSSFLRSMDSDMAERIVDQLTEEGVQCLQKTTVKHAELRADGRKQVQLEVDGELQNLTVDTILVAIGREGNPKSVSAEQAGIKFSKRAQKFQGRPHELERTNLDHIYAVGDIVLGVPELQPVAAQSGKMLAHRLKLRMEERPEQEILDQFSCDYDYIPTTVFSPVEYSYVGLSEAEATLKFGEEAIEVYHRETVPLQYNLQKQNNQTSYMKVITERVSTRVVGIHYYGPGADEMISGFALAMKLGLKKNHLDSSVGIHPSTSEDLFDLQITKRSGLDFRKTSC